MELEGNLVNDGGKPLPLFSSRFVLDDRRVVTIIHITSQEKVQMNKCCGKYVHGVLIAMMQTCQLPNNTRQKIRKLHKQNEDSEETRAMTAVRTVLAVENFLGDNAPHPAVENRKQGT